MKYLILLLLFIAIPATMTAQQDTFPCIPDSSFLNDPVQIVSPRPFLDSDTVPTGIPNEACINQPYELIFFLRAPKSFNFGGLPVTVTQFKIDTITGLPEGIDYFCSREDCIVKADSIMCLRLAGVPAPSNDTGIYSLSIELRANIIGLGTIPLPYPNDQIAPGTYSLVLNEEGNSACDSTTASHRVGNTINGYKIFPNPADQTIFIENTVNSNSPIDLLLYDISGRKVVVKTGIDNKSQVIAFPVGQLQQGLYFLQIIRKNQVTSAKVLISH